MKAKAFSLLADANIHPKVVQHLRDLGVSIQSVRDVNLTSASDRSILEYATRESKVVLTHDSDFGTLAILAGVPTFGIIYLRPGHINPAFHMATLEVLLNQDHDYIPPFIIVAERAEGRVKIRIRQIAS